MAKKNLESVNKRVCATMSKQKLSKSKFVVCNWSLGLCFLIPKFQSNPGDNFPPIKHGWRELQQKYPYSSINEKKTKSHGNACRRVFSFYCWWYPILSHDVPLYPIPLVMVITTYNHHSSHWFQRRPAFACLDIPQWRGWSSIPARRWKTPGPSGWNQSIWYWWIVGKKNMLWILVYLYIYIYWFIIRK